MTTHKKEWMTCDFCGDEMESHQAPGETRGEVVDCIYVQPYYGDKRCIVDICRRCQSDLLGLMKRLNRGRDKDGNLGG